MDHCGASSPGQNVRGRRGRTRPGGTRPAPWNEFPVISWPRGLRCPERSVWRVTYLPRHDVLVQSPALSAFAKHPLRAGHSAPATIPATRAATFTAGLDPAGPGTRRCVPTRSCNPARSASTMTGTRPACDTRFGSSKPTETLWQTRIYRMPLYLVRCDPREVTSSQVRRAFVCHDALKTPVSPVDRG
jgi:hypothetical protein